MQNTRDQERAANSAVRKDKRAPLTRPTVFVAQDAPSPEAARKRLEALKAGATQVHDLYEELLMELMLADNPGFKSTPDKLMGEFEKFQAAYRGEWPQELAGSWVMYSNGTLLHLLRSADHYRLRTSRNIGLITPQEQTEISRAHIAICGLSVGGSCVTTLAAEGVRSFFITDFDQLACSNLNRISSSLAQIGVDKTDIVAQKIWDIDPFSNVETEPKGFSQDCVARMFNPDRLPDAVVDAVDSMQAKIEMREACRKYGVPLVWMIDMGDGIVQIGVERYDRDRNYPAFHGALDRKRQLVGRELNYAESLISIFNNDRLPYRMADSFVKACNNQGAGISQLAGTVSIAAGAISRVVRKILLKEEVVSEFFIEVDEKADPDYPRKRLADQGNTYALLKEMGLRG